MNRQDYLATIYADLSKISPRVRRSMMLHNTIETVETTATQSGHLLTQDIVWMKSDNIYLRIVRFNIENKVFSGDWCIIYVSQLSRTVMHGVCKDVICAVCDLVWSEFLNYPHLFPVVQEDDDQAPPLATEQQQPEQQQGEWEQESMEIIIDDPSPSDDSAAAAVHKRFVPPTTTTETTLLGFSIPTPPPFSRGKGSKNE